MIPTLRSAFGSALDQLDDALFGLRRGGHLSEPWLGDETSSEVAAYYSRRAMDEPTSSYRSLEQYRAELNRIHDTLQRMEDAYRRTDTQAAASYGQRA
jgi:hypothetical protein